MPIPAGLGPSTRVIASQKSILSGGAAPISRHLGFSVSKQIQSNWCWSAVSHSIANYYNPKSSWTQCQIADKALGRTDCCVGGASDPTKCNKVWYLDRALKVTRNFVSLVPSPIPHADVQTEIGAGRPIGTRVGWFGGGGHFQAITGWTVGANGDEYITVSDPIYLDTHILLKDFAGNYHAGGNWNYSYLTDNGSGGGAAASSTIALTDSVYIGEDEELVGG